MDLSHKANRAVNIYFRDPSEEDPDGYISAYTSYPTDDGKDYTTGNDLADGGFTEETIERVIADIRAVMQGHRNAYVASGGQPIAVNLPFSVDG